MEPKVNFLIAVILTALAFGCGVPPAYREAEGPQVEYWQKMLKDESDDARAMAAEMLGRIGPEAKPAVPELTSLLKDPSRQVRLRSARALGKIGRPAEKALILLKKISTSPSEDSTLKKTARTAIKKIRAASPKEPVR